MGSVTLALGSAICTVSTRENDCITESATFGRFEAEPATFDDPRRWPSRPPRASSWKETRGMFEQPPHHFLPQTLVFRNQLPSMNHQQSFGLHVVFHRLYPIHRPSSGVATLSIRNLGNVGNLGNLVGLGVAVTQLQLRH